MLIRLIDSNKNFITIEYNRLTICLRSGDAINITITTTDIESKRSKEDSIYLTFDDLKELAKYKII